MVSRSGDRQHRNHPATEGHSLPTEVCASIKIAKKNENAKICAKIATAKPGKTVSLPSDRGVWMLHCLL